MTKIEILDALESVKDLTNHSGKQTIDMVKAAITRDLSERLDAPIPPKDECYCPGYPAPHSKHPMDPHKLGTMPEEIFKPLNKQEDKIVPRNFKSKRVTKFKK